MSYIILLNMAYNYRNPHPLTKFLYPVLRWVKFLKMSSVRLFAIGELHFLITIETKILGEQYG